MNHSNEKETFRMRCPPSSELTPEEQQRLHPDFLANEQSYLSMRDALLARYRGQWVAVHDGAVIAAGDDLVAVMDVVAESSGHPYVAKVGEEDEITFRIRRVEFGYDSTYRPFALPRATITFWNHSESRSQTFSDIVPDTGADLTALPVTDCAAFDLFTSPYFTGISWGITGRSSRAQIYRGKAEVNGRRVPAYVQPIAGLPDRLVGRDVLNHHRVVFDGPSGRVIFEP